MLFGKRPANADLAALLKNTSSDDLKWGHFPWIPLASGVFLAVVIGLLLIRSEGEKPMIRLRAELKQLARGEIFKIQDLHYGGRFGGLARDINAAIEHYTHAPSAPSAMSGKDLNAILGDSAGGKAFDLPSPGFGVRAATAAVVPAATAAQRLPTAAAGRVRAAAARGVRAAPAAGLRAGAAVLGVVDPCAGHRARQARTRRA